jgi:hypothetical protein
MYERNRNEHPGSETHKIDCVLVAPFFVPSNDVDANRGHQTRQGTGKENGKEGVHQHAALMVASLDDLFLV